jgi:WD40 repeat protein
LPTLDLAFSPDGTLLAALHGTTPAPGQEPPPREAKIWDLTTGQGRALPDNLATTIAFAPKEHALVTGEPSGGLVVRDPETGERQRGPFGGMGWQRTVFSPDGRAVVLGVGRTLMVRNLATGKVLASLNAGTIGSVVDAAYSPDGRLLATGTASPNALQGTEGFGELKVWERVQ